jgi:hypothetical protein
VFNSHTLERSDADGNSKEHNSIDEVCCLFGVLDPVYEEQDRYVDHVDTKNVHDGEEGVVLKDALFYIAVR